MSSAFQEILEQYRSKAFSERDKGARFERLIQGYLQTDPFYTQQLEKVWLWQEFPGRAEFDTGKDVGIDIVARTHEGEYWAIQCKFYAENAYIDKAAVDSFLATSSKYFHDEKKQKQQFSFRLWVSTSENKSTTAEHIMENQNPKVGILNLYTLENAKVDWRKIAEGISGDDARIGKDRQLFTHQVAVRDAVHEYFKKHDRGHIIMACGTGKTFTSLRIAEHETKNKGLILFLVPSIALLAQSLREWYECAQEKIEAICICSDTEVSRTKKTSEDTIYTSVTELAMPASTDVKNVLNQFKTLSKHKGLTVVFSTYQSIDVISKAQKKLAQELPQFGNFDLIICDEAHRTTGVTLEGEDESHFTKVHDNKFIAAKKRLYMTATPRLYGDSAKSKAKDINAVLCSMDDTSLYGERIYHLGFGEAVDNELLTDYKVLILTLNEHDVPAAIQKLISDENDELNFDDAAKLIGCINALSKEVLGDEGLLKETDPEPMRRAVAFCSTIKNSQSITENFNRAGEVYRNSLTAAERNKRIAPTVQHVDGSMGAGLRGEKLSWLKKEPKKGEAHILCNVRCLSEGVDVPALDAVLFLSARNSQVDVVQSVGRVMRRAPGKKYGYIIIPIIVPSTVDADKALDKNDAYKVVWSVLNALRAHDDRFNAIVNSIDLNKKKPPQIMVTTPKNPIGGADEGDTDEGNTKEKEEQEKNKNIKIAEQLNLQFEELQGLIYAKLVTHVGEKDYWENWAATVGELAKKQEARIKKLVKENPQHHEQFTQFLAGLHKNINPAVSADEAIVMLSQHIITGPVFNALFEDYSFVQNNPMSKAMQGMLDLLQEESFTKDTEILHKFYESVKRRVQGIDNAEGKQKIIIKLYDTFFRIAFPKMVEQLGIVYTPVEVVDFIIHSVNDILIKEFGRSISDENVHLLDPFTGTGTFITRLLQSGLIEQKDLLRKYKHEIHCNEIVLLAYYIAAVNIENAFHDLSQGAGEKNYLPFEGICLTDTFQLAENDNAEKLFSEMFAQNSARVQRQQKAPLRIIFGNPPYSMGQKSANDNAQNQSYPKLEDRITHTYAALTNASATNSLYDSYIKAFRWSSDRLDNNGGIICFVSNGAWLDSNSADGFRKSLEAEFDSIYVFNLRGNARSSGELRQKEAGNVFGGGSRTPIAITLLVKKPQ